MAFTKLIKFSQSKQNGKSSIMVTRDTPYLRIYLPRHRRKNGFPLRSLGWYLFFVVSDNRYQPRGSNGMQFVLLLVEMHLLKEFSWLV